MAHSVLLVFCWGGDKKLSINNLPPLGILGIASFLEERSILVDVLDFSIEPKAQMKPDAYDVIGFSINIANRKASMQVIADLKNDFPDQHIVVGGPLCMSNPELFMQSHAIDAIFTCEGEEALYEYLTAENRDNVKGIHLRNGSDYEFTGERDWIKDLDSLPYPAFHKVDIRKYNGVPKMKHPISSMMTSRGCPYSCIFCSHAMGRKWRARSPENVVKEIEWQVSEFGVKEICIYDDNFSLNKKRAEAICDLLIGNRVPVTLQFTNGLRVDNLDSHLLEKLKLAGTWLIGLAPESGNARVMEKIKKGFTHAQVTEIRRECKRFGIKTFGFFMIGFPFETRSEIEDTIEFAKKLDCEMVEFNKVVPYAKTELFEMIVESGNLISHSHSETQSYHEGRVTTHKVGDLTPDEVKDLIRKAYREYYLRIQKMMDLVQSFSIRDLLVLSTYAFLTKNI
jgi:anaerobic magnesium-protoporphyrin IX monomethyl ester cyclase